MTRKQWDELFVKVDDMSVEEIEKIIVDSARKAGVLQTNGDLVRQMSDEELADEYIRIYHRLSWYTDSWAWLRKWLKSPVGEE